MVLPGDAAAARVAADRARGRGRSPAARRWRWPGGTAHARWSPPRPALLRAAWTGARPRGRAPRRGLLTFAEPNRLFAARPGAGARPAVGGRGLARLRGRPGDGAAAGDSHQPLLALVDSQLDATHPEFAGGATTTLGGRPVTDSHGTATAAVAAAPKNDSGHPRRVAGDARAERAAARADRLRRLGARHRARRRRGRQGDQHELRLHVALLAEYVQCRRRSRAVSCRSRRRARFTEGNPRTFPASLPHVLTVAAIGRPAAVVLLELGAAIDRAGPARASTAVPFAFDEDGNPDGYQRLSGTSSRHRSWPARRLGASGAAALSVDQLAQVVRLTRATWQRGWDADTASGSVSVTARWHDRRRLAIRRSQRRRVVDGRGRRRKPSCSPGAARGLHRAARRVEDPADVYRIGCRGAAS